MARSSFLWRAFGFLLFKEPTSCRTQDTAQTKNNIFKNLFENLLIINILPWPCRRKFGFRVPWHRINYIRGKEASRFTQSRNSWGSGLFLRTGLRLTLTWEMAEMDHCSCIVKVSEQRAAWSGLNPPVENLENHNQSTSVTDNIRFSN